ncbi:DUF680 domain-containing protein [Mesorhizobium sp. ArgA1]
MKNIALTAAALLVATSSAFAGSDHYGSQASSQTTVRQTTATVDNTYTASTAKQAKVRHGMQVTTTSAADEPGQGIWGN